MHAVQTPRSAAQGPSALVPLSHAVCCRPCLPKEIPDTSGMAPVQQAVPTALMLLQGVTLGLWPQV